MINMNISITCHINFGYTNFALRHQEIRLMRKIREVENRLKV